jgi:HTH-type transcriptional regulator / antitoxin HigA
MNESTRFQPSWASPPGATILDILDERSISLADLAGALGESADFANDLLVGREEIDERVASTLSDLLGGNSAFWLAREQQFREDSKRKRRRLLEEDEGAWLEMLPLSDMAKFRWIPELPSSREQKLKAAYAFFGVDGLSEWTDLYTNILGKAAFRTASHPGLRLEAVSAWLRQGELLGRREDIDHWSPDRFSASLRQLRSLTREKDPAKFLPLLKVECGRCGVAVEVVRAPAGSGVSGATRFLSPDRALIQLSFRYLTDDQFWFTFFHEAGHLLLHGDNVLFIEDDSRESNREEQEANEFAASLLIPLEHHESLLKLRNRSNEIIRFAVRVGVSPGIVVGQLQHYGRLAPNQGNSLKRRFVWLDDDGHPRFVNRGTRRIA